MADTVKAVVGLNLEYSRFSLPNKTNPIAVTTVSNPDCNCSPSTATYQFPVNWDTGPEKLDVFFYPRNYSGSDLSLFTGNQGISRNFVSGNNVSSYYPSAYIEDPVTNTYTPITLTKTSNVFKDHPTIPKKRIDPTLNGDSSYSVFYDTHANISRKCWAGTATLGGDSVLVIYTYSKSGISVVLCYLGNASTECIHSADAAHGPHSVIISLSPGTHFGAKPTFTTKETYLFNDSYYYSLDMGNILTYYTFSNNFNNYYNGWYNWGYVYGLDSVYSGYWGYYNYVPTNYYYNHQQTSYAAYVKDAPLAGTSNWYCVSGRPQSVYHNVIDASVPNYRPTTDEEKEIAVSSFGTGIDSFYYITMYWTTVGAVAGIPASYLTGCDGTTHLNSEAVPARIADTEPDWQNPFVYAYDNNGSLIYDLSPLLMNMGYSWWGWWYNNGYLIRDNSQDNLIFTYGVGYPASNAECYTFYNAYNYYYGWSYYGNGPYSNGVWTINPDVPGAVTYACGTHVNETLLDDGTTTYSMMELLSVKSTTVPWPRIVIDWAAYQAMLTATCTPSYPCGNIGYTPYKQSGSYPTTYTKVVYKVSTVNLPVSLGIPQYTRITDNEQQEFDLASVNREFVKEPGYLVSTYYGSVEAKAKKIGRSDYNYFGNYCYSYGYDQVKYEVYPGSSESTDPPTDSSEELIISNCNEYSNDYYNWNYFDQRYLHLKFKASYVPYFFGGVRPNEGLVYPINLTEPKVRIFPTDPPDPEEFRDSNYPKYYFQEFDPSKIIISESKLLSVPPIEITTPPTPNTKIYLPDYENVTSKSTILPRATTMLQTVAEQTEYFQCEYLKGEFNDFYYYFPPSFLTQGGIDERLDFPEDIYGCENTLTPTIPSFPRSAFLFDPSKGEEQLRSAGTSFNYYNYYNNLSISYLDYPEITAAIYNFQREVANERKKQFPVYLPAWVHMLGMQVYDYGYYPYDQGAGLACNYAYGITSIAMGGTDLCTPITIVSPGVLSTCGTNLKKVEPLYSVMTGFEYYDAYDASKAVSDAAYESALSRATFHSHPVAMEYSYATSYTASGTAETGFICTPNYTTFNYTNYAIMSDSVFYTGNSGGWYGNYGSSFTKSYYDVTLPFWGRVTGMFYYGGFYNYYGGTPYNSVGGDTSFLDCDMLVADVGYTSKKQLLTGKNLSSAYSYYGGFFSYYGYGNLQSLNISSLSGNGTAVSFTDGGDLVSIDTPAGCGEPCKTPKSSTDVFYFDLIPVGGNSVFRGYGYGFYGYSQWLEGEMHCTVPFDAFSCAQDETTVRLSPEFPVQPPYNPCDPADYFWVEPCTRYYS